MIYFTSDLHLFHKKIKEFCPDRPGIDVDDMNEHIIRRWNMIVGVDDDAYILGDFSFGKSEETKRMVKRLSGRKHLVMGNHDRRSAQWYLDAGFTSVSTHHVDIKMHGINFRLCHYPFKLSLLGRLFYGIFDGGYARFQDRKVDRSMFIMEDFVLLHGHNHGKYYTVRDNAIDVGWDSFGEPVSAERILDIVSEVMPWTNR